MGSNRDSQCWSQLSDSDRNRDQQCAAWTYDWDGVNRLVAINYSGSTRRTELNYNGLSRCVKLVEKAGTAVTSKKRFVWEGTDRVEKRDASNAVTRRFFAEGVQMGGMSYYYTRDHLGSVWELTDSTGAVRTRYDYSPWGERTKVSGDLKSDGGFRPSEGFGSFGHVAIEPGSSILAPQKTGGRLEMLMYV